MTKPQKGSLFKLPAPPGSITFPMGHGFELEIKENQGFTLWYTEGKKRRWLIDGSNFVKGGYVGLLYDITDRYLYERPDKIAYFPPPSLYPGERLHNSIHLKVVKESLKKEKKEVDE